MIYTEILEKENILLPGDRVEITQYIRDTMDESSPFRKKIKGRVEYIHPQYVVINNGRYCEAFKKVDFKIGKLQIVKRVAKK